MKIVIAPIKPRAGFSKDMKAIEQVVEADSGEHVVYEELETYEKQQNR
jgi:hypothetical protein